MSSFVVFPRAEEEEEGRKGGRRGGREAGQAEAARHAGRTGDGARDEEDCCCRGHCCKSNTANGIISVRTPLRSEELPASPRRVVAAAKWLLARREF